MAATRSRILPVWLPSPRSLLYLMLKVEPILRWVSAAHPSGTHTPAPRGPSTTVTCCSNPSRASSLTLARVAGVGSGMSVGSVDETMRSEEHTSELQSLRHLVCRLLLEK